MYFKLQLLPDNEMQDAAQDNQINNEQAINQDENNNVER